jgi:hypothetical protein
MSPHVIRQRHEPRLIGVRRGRHEGDRRIIDTATMRYAKMTYQQFLDESAKAIPEMPANAGPL